MQFPEGLENTPFNRILAESQRNLSRISAESQPNISQISAKSQRNSVWYVMYKIVHRLSIIPFLCTIAHMKDTAD